MAAQRPNEGQFSHHLQSTIRGIQLVDLPPELLQAIIAYLDNASRRAVYRTSKALRAQVLDFGRHEYRILSKLLSLFEGHVSGWNDAWGTQIQACQEQHRFMARQGWVYLTPHYLSEAKVTLVTIWVKFRREIENDFSEGIKDAIMEQFHDSERLDCVNTLLGIGDQITNEPAVEVDNQLAVAEWLLQHREGFTAWQYEVVLDFLDSLGTHDMEERAQILNQKNQRLQQLLEIYCPQALSTPADLKLFKRLNSACQCMTERIEEDGKYIEGAFRIVAVLAEEGRYQEAWPLIPLICTQLQPDLFQIIYRSVFRGDTGHREKFLDSLKLMPNREIWRLAYETAYVNEDTELIRYLIQVPRLILPSDFLASVDEFIVDPSATTLEEAYNQTGGGDLALCLLMDQVRLRFMEMKKMPDEQVIGVLFRIAGGIQNPEDRDKSIVRFWEGLFQVVWEEKSYTPILEQFIELMNGSDAIEMLQHRINRWNQSQNL